MPLRPGPVYEEILRAASSVPRGRLTTFGEIARALGDYRAAKAVAEVISIMGRAYGVPWHRVVSSRGEILRGAEDPLREEGVAAQGGRVADLARRLVEAGELEARPILAEMRRAQRILAERVILEDEVERPELVAGADVAYRWERDEEGLPVEVARGAVVVVDADLRVVDGSIQTSPAVMPYVPTYLGFREFPALARALSRLSFDVVMMDGHGIAHPVFFGEASHVGVCLDVPALGVAKRRLVGKVRGEELIYMTRQVGWALPVRPEGRPVYVSPGHKVSLEGSARIFKKFRGGTRVPAPVRLAHKLAQFPKPGEGRPGETSSL
ncbi:MAG: hypothetical protein DRO01_05990 [Thermoproteota archaeon]|nr:MAG: hypothetical protein DRO01_05990 [Candidatus Korarchaeota archaeon]